MPLAYLLVVLYAIIALAAPILLIVLAVRQSTLRKRLDDLTEESTRERLKLQRAIGELQARLAVGGAVPAQPTQAMADRPAPAATAPVTLPPAAPFPVPPTETPSVPVPRIFPAASVPAPPVVPLAKTVPSAPAHVDAPALPKPPAAPSAQPHTPPAPRPVAPMTAPVTPPKPAAPPALHGPAASPAPPAAIPLVTAARSYSPSVAAPLQTAAPQIAHLKSAKVASSIEELLGTSWFAILGVIMTVIGLALLGKLALQNLGPGGKAMLIYVVGFLLLAAGIFIEKHDRYRLVGRLSIGGGWALLFFSTFGIYYVPAMHVLGSAPLDSVLMLGVAVAMGVHTLRYESQLVTGMAFLLGYTTVALSQDTVYSLAAGVMLAIGLVGIILKMGWFQLEVFGILASYLNHLYWLYRILGIQGAHGRNFPEYHASLALLFFYWLIFRISYVARNIKTDFEERVSTVAALLNSLLLLGVLKFQSVNPELAYLALFALGFFELAFALLAVTRRRRHAFVLLSVMGSALVLAAVPSHFTGNPVAILWLLGAEVFLAAGIIFEEVVFRRIGLLTGLLVGIDLFGFNFRPLLELRAHSEALDLIAGVLFGLCALVFYLNAVYVRSRWDKLFSGRLANTLLIIHSYLAAAAGATAAWALCANEWTAVAFAAAMLLLTALNRRIESRHLQIQSALLGALTLYRAFVFNVHLESPSHAHITTRLITLPLLGVLFYANARLAALSDEQEQRIFRGLFSFAGAAMFGFLIWTESPETWMAALFLAAGILLGLVARRWGLLHLSVQEHLFAFAALLQTVAYNFHAPGHYGPFSVRLTSVVLVAAGMYAISRKATLQDASHALAVAYLHTTAATLLLALLMWYEASTGWLAAIWGLFALVLTALDRRFELNDLRWQAHVVGAITMVRCLTINLHNEELWHGISVRLLTLSLVAVVFYAISRLTRMPEEWRARDFHHIYSWAASLLVSLLLWYELAPLSRAVGWAAFGFVLFEYGFQRRIAQYRCQAYVAFVASFVRIFFANLTVGPPGEFLGPRVYTVVPLVLIFFFVYAQLSEKQGAAVRERRYHSDVLVAYLGTATVLALFYFQFDPEWVVAAYAAVAFALLGAAWALQRETFLHQGILATLLTFARGMAHNLFGSSHFTERTWTGRYLVVSTAIVILFATLFFAFRLREAHKARPGLRSRNALFHALITRPERLQFFVPVFLLTVMLALKATEGMITTYWGFEGISIVLFALLVRERIFLRAAFGLLLLCVAKTLAMDVWRLDLLHGTITFIGVGLATTAASLLYIRYQDELKRYL